MIDQTRKGKAGRIMVHVLFWVATAVCFCHYSYLRPLSFYSWKEILSAVFLAGMVYTSYFVLIPKLLLRRRRVLFWLCVVLLIAATVAAELWLVDSDMHARAKWIKPDYFRIFYYTTACMLLFRDTSFFVFFLLLKLYRSHAIVLDNMGKAVSIETGKLIISSPDSKIRLVDFTDIALITYHNDQTIVTLKSGEQLSRDGYLSDVETLIPQEEWVRLNRHTLVMRNSIVRYTPTASFVRVKDEDIAIPYYSTRHNELLRTLKAWNPNLYAEEAEKVSGHEIELAISDDEKRVLEYIGKHPGATMQEVADGLHYSLRTAQRRIADLRQKGLIDRQSPNAKGGGYIATRIK